MWRDFKYLIAYVAPLAAYLGIYFQGIWYFGSIYVGFGIIPLLEIFLPGTDRNLTSQEEETKAESFFFDLLLYLNIPILYGLIFYYFHTLATSQLAVYEIVGMTCSVGLIVGTIGINVAHELGHRASRHEQLMSKALLLSALYMHFNIEHNRGHHKNVATDEDPASARFNESLYAFWLRSVPGAYMNAWRLERQRLKKEGKPFWSFHNEMILFQVIQLAWLSTVGLLFGWWMTGYALAIAVFGFLMLESVNYIEHYGLRRRLLAPGRYEKVGPMHSWNSDHELGRIFLYELTRHSDHHYKASRKYQILRHFDESPQLPTGYPAAIILSLFPPVWFRIMNRRVKETSGRD
jgi:alkane 1-monooxygenase